MTEILGCDACREGIHVAGQPRFVVATTATDLLYRCEECQTWWVGDGRSAGPVRDEVARERFPEHALPDPVTTAEEARNAAAAAPSQYPEIAEGNDAQVGPNLR